MRFTYCGGNGPQTYRIALLQVIGSLPTPESGLRAHLDHFWDMVVVRHFQLVSYDLRIAVEMAANLPYCISASYWKPIYTREWTRSLFRPFLVFRRFQLVSQFTYCGGNGPQTCLIALLQVIGSLTIPESGLGA